jgi:hypothetical protein
MGQRFYEVSIPALVRELARLNANLERIATRLDPDMRRETSPRPKGRTAP